MAIDNVFDQVEALIASDESQQLPEKADKLLKAIGHVPGTAPIVSMVRYETVKRQAENADLMLRSAWAELKRVSFKVEKLNEESASCRRLTTSLTPTAAGPERSL